MKYVSLLHIILLLTAAAGICAAQTRMERSVLSSGATRASNSIHVITATVGQPIIGAPKSSTHRGALGFWYNRNTMSTEVERIDSPFPASIMLEQNYPNPASTTTAIRFSIPTSRHVLLLVTDALGRMLRRVTDDLLESGTYKTDIIVGDLLAGTYFFRLYAGNEQLTRKFVVLR